MNIETGFDTHLCLHGEIMKKKKEKIRTSNVALSGNSELLRAIPIIEIPI
jgi:hypothetical protein